MKIINSSWFLLKRNDTNVLRVVAKLENIAVSDFLIACPLTYFS